MKRAPKTKSSAFLARAERLLKMKEGPEAERIRLAIREGLLVAGYQGGRKERGGALAAAMHCMDLVSISAKSKNGIEGNYEPEFTLTYLANAAEALEHIVDAVTFELDGVEAEIDARKLRESRRADRRAA